MALNITITDAGRAEIINATNTGTEKVTITQIGFTATAFAPTVEQTTLPDEIKRVSSIAGEIVAPDTISVTAKDEGPDSYTMRGFGVYSQAGTLLAVYGQADPIIEKSSGSTMLLTIDIILADLETTAIEFGDISFSNPPASLTTPGVVTLSNAVDSTAQNQAATPAAVKTANDNANTRLAKSQNLADLISAATARVNLGLGTSATLGNTASRTSASTTVLLQAAAMNDHRTSADHDNRYPQRAKNLSDLTSAATARVNLGLGTSAILGNTASRTSASTTLLLQAAAMNEHRQSDDHDGRYVKKTGDVMTGKLVIDNDVFDRHLEIKRGSMRVNISPSTANGGELRFSATDIIRTLFDTELAALKFIGNGEGLTGTAPLRATGTTKEDVGLSNIPNSTTLSRTMTEVGSLLEAKAMNDHGVSGDHDGRYVKKAGDSMEGELVIDNDGFETHLTIKRSDLVAKITISTAENGQLRFNVVNIAKTIFGNELQALKFIGDGSGLTGTAPLRATGTTKGDVGLSNIPNSTTLSRTMTEVGSLLEAKAMNDHRVSGDHDGRYLQRANNLGDLINVANARSNLGLGSAAEADRQSSALDRTPGRLLAVGAGGLLSNGSSQPPVVSFDDVSRPVGFYRFDINNTPDAPYSGGGAIKLARSDEAALWIAAGIFGSSGSNIPTVAFRTTSGQGNDFGEWEEAYHTGNIDEAFPRTGGTNGVQMLPNGFMFQYGYVDYLDIADERSVDITFNTTFPNQPVYADFIINSGQGSVAGSQRSFTDAGFTAVLKEFDQVVANGRLYWFAIGY